MAPEPPSSATEATPQSAPPIAETSNDIAREEMYTYIDSGAGVAHQAAMLTPAETLSAHPTPTREQIYAATERADATVEPPGNPDDDAPRCSW